MPTSAREKLDLSCGDSHSPSPRRQMALRVGGHPVRPQNLQVLPKTLSTDSVFALMLDVANSLGVSCGHCHVGGDNATWDSTNFASDAIAVKNLARSMFKLTNTLNNELLPAIVRPAGRPVVVTCMTCHRGALRPMTLQDTLSRVLDREGVDSAIAVYERIRQHYAGQMTYDLTEFSLSELATRLEDSKRVIEAVRILELNAREFPMSANVAYQLGGAYELAGDRQHAITLYHKVLSIDPGHSAADKHLRALMAESKPPA